ncbi:MAG: Mur ligase family protein [Ornithinimicrobium sp.]
MRLADLAAHLDVRYPSASAAPEGGSAADTEVGYLTHQADWVQPGDAFVAITGARFDGHAFIADALTRGAVAVLGQGLPPGIDCPVPYLVVPNARAALADAAAALAGHPSASMTVIGITGTDGKTTTSCLARHLLRATGRRTGLLSTIGYELGDGVLRQPPAHFTTPESPQVQQILAEMHRDGVEIVVVETSSHALALDRVRGVDYDIAVWTNLSAEHLDFHGSMQGYFEHKALLVKRAARAVLNAEDPCTQQLLALTKDPVLYAAEPTTSEPSVDEATGGGRGAAELGVSGPAAGSGVAIWASDVVEGPDDLRFTLHTGAVTTPTPAAVGSASDSGPSEPDAPDSGTTNRGTTGDTQAAVLPMIGRFNVANAVAAIAASRVAGADMGELVQALASFAGVPGRMEMAPREVGQPRVIVDFAHTPPSLEKALETVRVTTTGRLWVVLGSAGGPRDPGKRAPLGAAASAGADQVIFTEEDHRDTPIADILDEMERGAREAGRTNFVSISDRVEAIAYAVSSAAADDTIVLAGKGPEATLERDTETIAWDEMGEAVLALARR